MTKNHDYIPFKDKFNAYELLFFYDIPYTK